MRDCAARWTRPDAHRLEA